MEMRKYPGSKRSEGLTPRTRAARARGAAAIVLVAAWGAFAGDPGKLPAFSLPDLEGKARSEREFAGKVVVIDFWATWCSACKETVPRLAELQAKYRDRGLTVLGISVDKGSAEKIRKAAKKLGINYLILHDKENSLAGAFGFTGIPSLYVFDRAGGLTASLPGYGAGQEARLAEAAAKALGP
jgi:peroxiredoxin